MKDVLDALLIHAKIAAKAAYSPYSGFKVGSAVQTKEGKVFSGCNIENASYSLTICAERTAIFKAVSEGYHDLVAIAIYVDADIAFPPCGACRQVLAEFNHTIPVLYANNKESVYTDLGVLLPGVFLLNDRR